MRIMMIATAIAFAATPALAQQNGLINVDLSNLSVAHRAEIAKDINVDVSQIPVTVQVPVSVAAAICDVAVNVIAKTKSKGGTACAPTAGSDAINAAVQKQLKQQR